MNLIITNSLKILSEQVDLSVFLKENSVIYVSPWRQGNGFDFFEESSYLPCENIYDHCMAISFFHLIFFLQKGKKIYTHAAAGLNPQENIELACDYYRKRYEIENISYAFFEKIGDYDFSIPEPPFFSGGMNLKEPMKGDLIIAPYPILMGKCGANLFTEQKESLVNYLNQNQKNILCLYYPSETHDMPPLLRQKLGYYRSNRPKRDQELIDTYDLHKDQMRAWQLHVFEMGEPGLDFDGKGIPIGWLLSYHEYVQGYLRFLQKQNFIVEHLYGIGYQKTGNPLKKVILNHHGTYFCYEDYFQTKRPFEEFLERKRNL